MARDGFDCSELMEFAEQLGAQPKELEKVQKKLLRDQGSKLRRKTAQQARATVNRTAVHRKEYDRAAGQYHKSIKRGKVYTKDGQMRIRVYSVVTRSAIWSSKAGRPKRETVLAARSSWAARCLTRPRRTLMSSFSKLPRTLWTR